MGNGGKLVAEVSKHESITCSNRSLEAIFIGIETATWVNFPREITIEKLKEKG